jgi:flagellar motor switch protein FliN/FliY
VNPAEIDALVAQAQAGKLATPGVAPAHETVTEAPAFAEFGHAGGGVATETPLSLLMDLTLPVSIELGRTSMTVQEVLRLGRGSVVQLERLAGEPIDIYVGDRRFAEGEVVVLGEHFGVRVTRILNPGANVASAA